MDQIGTPQGTVLSPFLFSLCTADCQTSHDDCNIAKYADDTILTGLITDNDDTHFRRFIRVSMIRTTRYVI